MLSGTDGTVSPYVSLAAAAVAELFFYALYRLYYAVVLYWSFDVASRQLQYYTVITGSLWFLIIFWSESFGFPYFFPRTEFTTVPAYTYCTLFYATGKNHGFYRYFPLTRQNTFCSGKMPTLIRTVDTVWDYSA